MAPCHRRLCELERAGAIRGYWALVDPAAIGFGFEVLVLVMMEREDAATIAHFERGLAEVAEVRHAERLFGDPDYLVRVATADLAAYQDLRDEQLATLPGVQRTHLHDGDERIVDERPFPIPPPESRPQPKRSVGRAAPALPWRSSRIVCASALDHDVVSELQLVGGGGTPAIDGQCWTAVILREDHGCAGPGMAEGGVVRNGHASNSREHHVDPAPRRPGSSTPWSTSCLPPRPEFYQHQRQQGRWADEITAALSDLAPPVLGHPGRGAEDKRPRR